MSSLAEELPKEIARVQDLLPIYDAIPAGVFAATLMRDALKRAAAIIMSGDVVEMIRIYEELKSFKA